MGCVTLPKGRLSYLKTWVSTLQNSRNKGPRGLGPSCCAWQHRSHRSHQVDWMVPWLGFLSTDGIMYSAAQRYGTLWRQPPQFIDRLRPWNIIKYIRWHSISFDLSMAQQQIRLRRTNNCSCPCCRERSVPLEGASGSTTQWILGKKKQGCTLRGMKNLEYSLCKRMHILTEHNNSSVHG